ncbi:MAG TPA: outer membrane protein transport protein [Haliangiales bacterium]|nr:outer membrane protein transport protein [Haliangiales bacterium]
MVCVAPAAARAGALYVGEVGPQGLERGGAFVAKADDPTALLINPAGLMKARRGEIFLGSTLAAYSLKYQKAGAYPNQPNRSPQPAYVGQAYQEIKSDSGPQPLPALAATYRFDGVPLAVGLGVFAPPAFPDRDFKCNVDENCVTGANGAPAPQRYDVVFQDASIILPSVGAAYRIIPDLDVGVRLSWGFGKIQARSFTWGVIPNPEGDPTQDGDFSVDVKDNFIPQAQVGVLYRPTSFLELGAQWTSGLTLGGKGTGNARLGANISPLGQAMLVPVDDAVAVCEKGGTTSQLKACVTTKIPMHASLGGRYIFRDDAGRERADVELDLRWENWSAAPDTEVVVDAKDDLIGLVLRPSLIRHAFKDVFVARLGGHYEIPVGTDTVHLMGGIAFDSAAAPTSWTRVDFDGKERFTLTLGAAYELSWLRVDIGAGVVLEPDRTVTDIANANPTFDNRQQPDPIQPNFPPAQQRYAPFNAGTYTSSYFLASLGVTAKF